MNRRNSVLQLGLFSRSKDIFVLLSVLGFAAAFFPNGRAASTEDIFKQARGAVVEILTQDKAGTPLKTGTGFFVSADGILLTNRHVVEGAASIGAKTEQGAYFFCQGILAEPKDADLVVLKFEAKDVPFLELASGIHGAPGQKVIVIGNPLGLEGTVSEGIISAIRSDQGLVQISAPISPGSSGSPVLTEDGKVIGVATLQSREGQNLNFAISAAAAQAALAGLDQKKPVASLAEATPKSNASENQAPEVARAREFLASYDDTDAVRILKEYLAKNPTDAEAWIVYAEACFSFERQEEAVDAAQKAVELDPENLDRWRVLTYCLAMLSARPPYDTDQVLLSRLKQVAEHDLAMGDDFNMAYHTLIKVAESLGYKDQAGKLREQYQQLKTSPGALADYTFGKEIRYFGSQMMFPAEQVAKEKGMALTDDVLYLDLKGKGHSFSILKDVPNVDGRLQGVPDVLVDGIPMTLDLPPARYKHQRYYLDGGLVDFVFGGLLNPRKMVRPPFLPDFRFLRFIS